jgi:uncharacterized protein (DUF1778 family)
MRLTAARVARHASLAIGIAWLLSSSGASNALDLNLTVVASAAGQSSEIVDRMVSSAYSEAGDTVSLQTFQQLSSEVVTLLEAIENESLAGTPLSGTRDRFIRVTQLVNDARHVVDEGRIHVESVDEVQLSQLLLVLDEQYSPRPGAALPGLSVQTALFSSIPGFARPSFVVISRVDAA